MQTPGRQLHLQGRDQFGLPHVDVASDPTLRHGDVVATHKGLVAFTGRNDETANFTPVESYRYFSKRYRDKLSDIRIPSAHR